MSCNLTTFKFFVRVPPGLYCHPIERAYCQVKPERIETHTGGAPGAGSGLRRLLGPGHPCPAPRERAGRRAGAACGPRAGIVGTDLSPGSAAAKAAPAPQKPGPGMGMGQSRACVKPQDRAPLRLQSILALEHRHRPGSGTTAAGRRGLTSDARAAASLPPAPVLP